MDVVFESFGNLSITQKKKALACVVAESLHNWRLCSAKELSVCSTEGSTAVEDKSKLSLPFLQSKELFLVDLTNNWQKR